MLAAFAAVIDAALIGNNLVGDVAVAPVQSFYAQSPRPILDAHEAPSAPGLKH
jgi:hypothetical protein